MAPIDTKMTDVEYVEDQPSKLSNVAATGVTSDAELAAALRNYVPGSEAEKKLVRKIDYHLMPILWIMYVLNYVDRTNIGNAKIAGMDKDLDLDDNSKLQRHDSDISRPQTLIVTLGYAWVLSIFFFGYLLFEIPSNMVLSRSRPSWFLPGIMFTWGAFSCIMALSKTYGAMLGFRFVLGCIESGFFPGVLYLLSCWYKSYELGKRFAIFYTAAVLSGAFGGLLAGAITGHLDGAHGIAGWRWLFIIEGAATVGVAIIAKFILLDFPSNSSAFTLEERQLAAVRIISEGKSAGVDADFRLTHWQSFMAALADPRTYLFLVLFVLDVGAGTISYFIPTITKTLGYTTVHAQYMTVPVYVVATVVLNITAWSADRNSERRYHISAALCLGFVCALVCCIVSKAMVRYVMLCFVAAGIWSALPLILAWTQQTIQLPAEKRAVVIALVNACGNFSSVYGSRIWPSHDGPRYVMGWAITAAFLGAGCVLALTIPIWIKVLPKGGTKAERELELRKSQAATEGPVN